MSEIVVLVPVLDRPQRAHRVTDSLREATATPYRLLFLCTKGDRKEIAACHEAVEAFGGEVVICPFPLDGGDFARKTNYGISISSEPWVFAGADDLYFERGWDVVALAVAGSMRKRFIGTNDLHNPRVVRGKTATHPLVARSYIDECGTIDEPGKLYHEGYGHAWVDGEAAETAMARGEWAFARRAHVEHLHPLWTGAPADATYERGSESYLLDRELFLERRRLWRPHASMKKRTTGSRARPLARRPQGS